MSAPPAHPAPQAARDRLARLKARARAALWWERIWPPLAALLSLGALYVALAWFGLFLIAPVWARGVALALLALGAAAILVVAARRLRRPGEAEALARLDRDSGRAHRPVSAALDALADPQADAATRALWEAHRARALAAAAGTRVKAPSPRLVDRDRFALRALALFLLAASAFVAGPEKAARLAAAFDLTDRAALAAVSRLDAFFDPPAYTGRPAIILPTRAADASGAAFFGSATAVEAPVGSRLVLRSAGDAPTLDVSGALAPLEEETRAQAPLDAGVAEKRFVLKADAHLSIRQAGRSFVFDVKAIPDRPPSVALIGDPASEDKTLSLRYRAEDDYGLESLEARFSDPLIGGRRMTGRSLVPPPSAPLPLPAGGAGEAQGAIDLADHAWAGARVTMTLVGRDGAGQEGRSVPVEVTLPARRFAQPLARALVELRRDLLLQPDTTRLRVDRALSALEIAPDLFGERAGVYLGLATARTRLRKARDDDGLRDVAAYLWEIALAIEEGDLAKARDDLARAQQALREAMERGAPPDEIAKLMDDLRAAMDRFLREFAQNQPPQSGAPSPDAQEMTRLDLDKMLKDMEDAARRGDMAEAQRLLDQLQNMMQNLRRAENGDAGRREMNRQMGELDRMTRDQGKLRDDTFRKERGEQGEASPQQDGQPSDQELERRQQALRERLEQLQERMKRQGLDPEQGLKDAEGAMREAERELGNQSGPQGESGRQGQQGRTPRDRGAALDAQGRALEGLRRGMEGLSRQMQAQGEGQGQDGQGQSADGRGDPNGRQGGRGAGRLDPLDRPRADRQGRGLDQRGLDPTLRPADRARRVQEELRRRLGEPQRPREELDYYERLLRAN